MANQSDDAFAIDPTLDVSHEFSYDTMLDDIQWVKSRFEHSRGVPLDLSTYKVIHEHLIAKTLSKEQLAHVLTEDLSHMGQPRRTSTNVYGLFDFDSLDMQTVRPSSVSLNEPTSQGMQSTSVVIALDDKDDQTILA